MSKLVKGIKSSNFVHPQPMLLLLLIALCSSSCWKCVCTNNVFIVFFALSYSLLTRPIILKMKMNIPLENGVVFVQSHWTYTIASIHIYWINVYHSMLLWVCMCWNRFLYGQSYLINVYNFFVKYKTFETFLPIHVKKINIYRRNTFTHVCRHTHAK